MGGFSVTRMSRATLLAIIVVLTAPLGAATDCSQKVTRLDLAGTISWLCQEHFTWHLTPEAGKCESKLVGFGGKQEKACAPSRAVEEIDRVLSGGPVTDLIKRRMVKKPDTLPLALGRFVEAMAFSYKLDGKLNTKPTVQGEVSGTEEDLPVSDAVLSKSKETAKKYKEKFGSELPTFFRRLHKQDVAHQTAAQFTGDTLTDRAVLSGLVAVAQFQNSDVDVLRRVLAELWAEELKREHVEYHERKAAIGSAMDSSGYSRQNFGYGRTYFCSFLNLVESTAVLRSGLEEPDAKMLVLGSSLGWHAYYASLMYGTQVTGYELLQPRVDAAMAVGNKYGLTSKAHFIHGDLLSVPTETINQASVIFMTDLLWDDTLLSQILKRIGTEAKSGVVVVSNRGEGGNVGLIRKATVEVKVSWKDEQKFFVHQKD